MTVRFVRIDGLGGCVLHQMKLHIISLIAGLAALFSVDRLNQSAFDVAATPTSFHLLTAGLVILLLVTRLAQVVPPAAVIAAVAVAYCGSLAFVDGDRFTGMGAMLMALEVGLACSAVAMAIRVAKGLREFEESVENITLGEQVGVMSLADAREDIAIEMSRARRHERPLTVTVLSYEPDDVHASLHNLVQDVQQRMMQRYIMTGLASVAAQSTRRGDIVVEDTAANRVIVLSPESTPEQLDALTHRLRESAYRSLNIPVRFGVAGFPNSALTFEDLVATASGEATSARPFGQPRSNTPAQAGIGAEPATYPSVRTIYRETDDVAATHLGEPAHAIHGD
jgi:hypothetical protein